MVRNPRLERSLSNTTDFIAGIINPADDLTKPLGWILHYWLMQHAKVGRDEYYPADFIIGSAAEAE